MSQPKTINNYPVFSAEPCSEGFARRIFLQGSSVADCEACGRTHYSGYHSGDFDEGELERLEQKRKEFPDQYVDQGFSISYGTIDGMQVVCGCPCNYDGFYEKKLISQGIVS